MLEILLMMHKTMIMKLHQQEMTTQIQMTFKMMIKILQPTLKILNLINHQARILLLHRKKAIKILPTHHLVVEDFKRQEVELANLIAVNKKLKLHQNLKILQQEVKTLRHLLPPPIQNQAMNNNQQLRSWNMIQTINSLHLTKLKCVL